MNDLAPNMRQTINWNNGDPIYWRICTSLDFIDEWGWIYSYENVKFTIFSAVIARTSLRDNIKNV